MGDAWVLEGVIPGREAGAVVATALGRPRVMGGVMKAARDMQARGLAP